MAKMPDEVQVSQTVKAIYAAYEARRDDRPSRRLGASVIGQECSRRIWYSFRWAGSESFDGRMLRLFDTGHREEPRLVADLRAIGCEVWDVDDATGQQWEYTAVGGHVVTKLDAVAMGVPEAPKTPHVCEFKTHGAKSFAQVSRKGLKAGKPEHYAQLITGMKLANIPAGCTSRSARTPTSYGPAGCGGKRSSPTPTPCSGSPSRSSAATGRRSGRARTAKAWCAAGARSTPCVTGASRRRRRSPHG
jgi:hypothetical protein